MANSSGISQRRDSYHLEDEPIIMNGDTSMQVCGNEHRPLASKRLKHEPPVKLSAAAKDHTISFIRNNAQHRLRAPVSISCCIQGRQAYGKLGIHLGYVRFYDCESS